MILLDFSQIVISNLMVYLNGVGKNDELNKDLVAHMALNSIRMYNMKFGSEYGEMVICCDSSDCWRKKEYMHYKSSRKENRKESDFDWEFIFDTINQVREEIREFFPYKVLQVPHAEADDIIGTLTRKYAGKEPIVIVSGDKDFQQLQKYATNIKQWAPVQKKWFNTTDAVKLLKEHIIYGDRSDSVPNFLSAGDVFVKKIRQTPISKKKLAEWLEMSVNEIIEDVAISKKMDIKTIRANWDRNDTMINLAKVPSDIQQQALADYSQEAKGTMRMVMRYLAEKRMKRLSECIQEFKPKEIEHKGVLPF